MNQLEFAGLPRGSRLRLTEDLERHSKTSSETCVLPAGTEGTLDRNAQIDSPPMINIGGELFGISYWQVEPVSSDGITEEREHSLVGSEHWVG